MNAAVHAFQRAEDPGKRRDVGRPPGEKIPVVYEVIPDYFVEDVYSVHSAPRQLYHYIILCPVVSRSVTFSRDFYQV